MEPYMLLRGGGTVPQAFLKKWVMCYRGRAVQRQRPGSALRTGLVRISLNLRDRLGLAGAYDIITATIPGDYNI